ncbi:IS701 family transposase [Streptomyces lasalocidi]
MAVRFASRTSLGEETPVTVFAERLFAHLPRADQRRWAQAYLEGLLATPGKKSVRRLAAAVSASPTAGQSLRQFVNSSPWDWGPARRELARWTQEREPVRAWTLGRAVLPKRGDRSVGVQRRFVASSGRTLNCQLAMGAFLSTRTVIVPVDWHLLLSERWAADQQLRGRARIPESVRHRPVWEHALALVDSMVERSRHPAVPVVADMSDCQDAGPLVRGLSYGVGRTSSSPYRAGSRSIPAGRRPRQPPGPSPRGRWHGPPRRCCARAARGIRTPPPAAPPTVGRSTYAPSPAWFAFPRSAPAGPRHAPSTVSSPSGPRSGSSWAGSGSRTSSTGRSRRCGRWPLCTGAPPRR